MPDGFMKFGKIGISSRKIEIAAEISSAAILVHSISLFRWKMQPNTPFTKMYVGSDMEPFGGA